MTSGLTQLSFTPAADFVYTIGQVDSQPVKNNPPGPIQVLPIPLLLTKRRVFIGFELPFNGVAVGNVIFRLDGFIVHHFPFGHENGGSNNQDYPAFGQFNAAANTNIGEENTLDWDSAFGGAVNNLHGFDVDVQADTVAWEPDPRFLTNAAGAGPGSGGWRWFLGCQSQNSW